METLKHNYHGLSIEVRWSSANRQYVVEVFDGEQEVTCKYRNVYNEISDEEFLAMMKLEVDAYLSGTALRSKTVELFNDAL